MVFFIGRGPLVPFRKVFLIQSNNYFFPTLYVGYIDSSLQVLYRRTSSDWNSSRIQDCNSTQRVVGLALSFQDQVELALLTRIRKH